MRRRKHEAPEVRMLRRDIKETKQAIRDARAAGDDTTDLKAQLRYLEDELSDAAGA